MCWLVHPQPLKTLSELTVMFLHTYLSFSLEKLLSPDCWEWEESAFRQLSALSLVTTASKVKQTLPFHQPGLLMTFEQQVLDSTFGYRSRSWITSKSNFLPKGSPYLAETVSCKATIEGLETLNNFFHSENFLEEPTFKLISSYSRNNTIL